jgi:hypothetical protein
MVAPASPVERKEVVMAALVVRFVLPSSISIKGISPCVSTNSHPWRGSAAPVAPVGSTTTSLSF